MSTKMNEWSTDDWNTPREILIPTRQLFRGTIDLDPFSNETSIVEAVGAIDGHGADDYACGFRAPWSRCTPQHEPRVFVNGPWSQNKSVVAKVIDEWIAGCEIVAVVPTSLNSSYWHYVEEAPATCRPYRRIAFLKHGDPVKGNRQDCMIAYWGRDHYRFRALFSELGRVRFG